ncbi:hypothetical protein [Clostridium cuniculi]|uniref:hypothetical protein n=1 Tax=Clostridium cuniculi TaxID=2548455 RepID=UPI0018AC3A0D|nr:hypothetical protein [Clostridium cuniculi]
MLEELKLTEEQLQGVNKVIQSETDKVRTEYSKKIKELESKLPVEPSEEEKAFQERIKALEERERAIAQKEFETELQGKLKDKGLNEQLSKYLNVQGVEDLETYLEEVAKVIGNQIEGYKPRGHESNVGVTKEQFSKMSYVERMNLFETNRQLYDTLSK